MYMCAWERVFVCVFDGWVGWWVDVCLCVRWCVCVCICG